MLLLLRQDCNLEGLSTELQTPNHKRHPELPASCNEVSVSEPAEGEAERQNQRDERLQALWGTPESTVAFGCNCQVDELQKTS